MHRALSKLLYRPGAYQPHATSHSPAGHRGITDAATASPCCSSESQKRPFAQELGEDLGRGAEHGEDTPWELQFAQVHAVVQSPIVFTRAPCLDVVLE